MLHYLSMWYAVKSVSMVILLLHNKWYTASGTYFSWQTSLQINLDFTTKNENMTLLMLFHAVM